jgi:hypothetical protein
MAALERQWDCALAENERPRKQLDEAAGHKANCRAVLHGLTQAARTQTGCPRAAGDATPYPAALVRRAAGSRRAMALLQEGVRWRDRLPCGRTRSTFCAVIEAGNRNSQAAPAH